MLIVTSTMEVDPDSVIHVCKYLEPGEPGFFRYRDGRGRMATVGGIPHAQLDALAAAMPNAARFEDEGYREDWLSRDRVLSVEPEPGNPLRSVAYAGEGETLLMFDEPLAEVRTRLGLAV